MKKLLALLLLFGIVGCTGLQTIGGGAQDLTRTEELLVAGYSVEQIENAKSNGTFNQMLSYARSSGAVQRGYQEYIAGFNKPELNRYIKQEDNAKQEARQQIAQAEQDRLTAFIDGIKLRCKSYGFTEENAIATCVQTEINNEITRLQANQVYANAQARANATQRNNALSNMGRCLSAESSFAACGNAWSGYTPKPAKKVYRCDYDVFGNQITSTCREQ